MEKEKAICLPPDVKDSLTLHKNLPEQYSINSCQHKLMVCAELMVLKGFDDTEVKDYLDEVKDYLDYQDEFFNLMRDVEHKWCEDLERDEYYRLWFWFLKQSIKDLKYTIEYLKFQEKKTADLMLLKSLRQSCSDLLFLKKSIVDQQYTIECSKLLELSRTADLELLKLKKSIESLRLTQVSKMKN